MKKTLLSILGVSLLLLGSCSQEARLGDIPRVGKAQLTIEIESLAQEGGAATRGAMTRGADNVASVAGENSVTSLYLLFFNSANGEYVDYTEVELPGPVVDPDNEEIVLDPNGPTKMNVDGVAFPADKVAGEYNVLALANVADYYFVEETFEHWIALYALGKNESAVMANAMGLAPATIASNRIPMYGRMEKVAEEDQLHMTLSRIVSRLDVTNNATTTHKLVSATIWNGFPETMIWGDAIPDFSDNTERIRRHYGVTVEGNVNKIRGGLYAFENQVGSPEANDQLSTCLIIGMQEGSDPIEYFRANLYDQTGRQNLRRNYVYNLVIDAVEGQGAPTEEIAYLGESNSLVYHILDWDEDQNGLIVRDDFSSLSIPTKTVNLGGTPAVAEFKIHTFSTLPSPSPLQIRSQTYRPAAVEDGFAEHGGSPIWAELDGNTLVINATKLNLDETERRGVIVLSFAGLEIAMNVFQSGTHDDFLIVTEPDGGILPFAAYPGIGSGLINVQASGHWTATLHMTGFSFNSMGSEVDKIWTDPNKDNNNTLGLIIPDETNSTIDKFRVFTHSSNETNGVREAFIVIELDGKEEQYSSVVMLSQDFVKSLKYARGSSSSNLADPNVWMESGGSIAFDGMGVISGGSEDKWFIQTPLDGNGEFREWTAQIVPTGTDSGHFEVVAAGTSYDETEQIENFVTVKAKAPNYSGRAYQATLRVFVTTEPGIFTEIPLTQASAGFDLRPGGTLNNKVRYQGGNSDAITIDAQGGDEMKWSIASEDDIVTEQSRIGNHNRTLSRYGEVPTGSGRQNDPVTIVLVNANNGNPTGETFEYGEEYDMDTGFRVKMPKIYFPNRDINVTAAVTVTVNSEGATEGGMEETVRVPQEALVAKKYGAGENDSKTDYGNLGGDESLHYFGEFRKGIAELLASNWHSTNQNTFPTERNPIAITLEPATWSAGAPNQGYLNFVYRTNRGFQASNTWNNTRAYIDGTYGHDGLYMITATYNNIGGDTGLNERSNSPMYGWDFHSADETDPHVNDDVSDTKIYQFIMKHTIYEGLTKSNIGQFNDYGEKTHAITTSLNKDAVPLVRGDGPQDASEDETVLVIDPKQRFIYLGDTEIFGGWINNTSTNGGSFLPISTNQRNFMRNLMSYMGYTMRYGSGFSDLLIDDETAAGGGMPAPWDSWWGANAVPRFDDTWPNLKY
jgi:hypothetical protein